MADEGDDDGDTASGGADATDTNDMAREARELPCVETPGAEPRR